MLNSASYGRILAIVCAVAASSCGSYGSTATLASPTALTASAKGQLVRPRDDGAAPVPAPNPIVVPCLPPAPAPAPVLAPPPPPMDMPYVIARTLSAAGQLVRPKDDGAAPCQTNMWTVGVVSSNATLAFNPNPVMPMMGDVLVWSNTDTTTHRLVLDDGTPDGRLIGVIAPGESTQPLALTNPLATYHCTIHPSMVGYIGMPAGGANPTPGAQPAPPPYSYDPPPDYNYSYRARATSQGGGR